MLEVIVKEMLQDVLRTIIGQGKIMMSGTEQEYVKGDVMKYLDGSKVTLYKCKKDGKYSIPTEDSFTKISLVGGK